MLRKILHLNNEALSPYLIEPGEIKQEGRRKLYRFVLVLELSKLGTHFMEFIFYFFLANQNVMPRTESVFIGRDNYDVWCKISHGHVCRSEASRSINHFHLFPVNEYRL